MLKSKPGLFLGEKQKFLLIFFNFFNANHQFCVHSVLYCFSVLFSLKKTKRKWAWGKLGFTHILRVVQSHMGLYIRPHHHHHHHHHHHLPGFGYGYGYGYGHHHHRHHLPGFGSMTLYDPQLGKNPALPRPKKINNFFPKGNFLYFLYFQVHFFTFQFRFFILF